MKRTLSLLTLLAIAFTAFAQDFSAVAPSGQTLYYRITSRTPPFTVQLTRPQQSYISTLSGALTVPSSVSYQDTLYSVTSIDNLAFFFCEGLTQITLPNTITHIGEQAFGYCSSLTSANMPTALDTIQRQAFSECRRLSSLSLPPSLKYIGESAFSQCDSLGGDLIIPDSVTYLGDYAFYSCENIASLTLSSSLRSIGSHTFQSCSGIAGTVTIPNGVTSIETDAFNGCSSITTLILSDSLTHISSGAFQGCQSLTGTLTIPNAVTDIDEMAFYGCRHLTGIRLSNSLVNIGYATFCGCRSIVRLDIPAPVTTIERYAFAECEQLTWITLPSTLTTMGDAVFTQCYQLRGITSYATTPPTLGNLVFDQVRSDLQVFVPCYCTQTYQAHSDWGLFQNYSEIFNASLVVESINENLGTVTITQYPTCENHTATFRATPKPGSHFVRWSDGSTQPERSVQVDEDVVYTAYFETNSTQTIQPTQASQPLVTASSGSIHVANADGQWVTIYDLAGRQLHRQPTLAASFSVPHKGIYLVRIGTHTSKVFVP